MTVRVVGGPVGDAGSGAAEDSGAAGVGSGSYGEDSGAADDGWGAAEVVWGVGSGEADDGGGAAEDGWGAAVDDLTLLVVVEVEGRAAELDDELAGVDGGFATGADPPVAAIDTTN